MNTLIFTLLTAIHAVESDCGLTSRNELQIRDICIEDVNRIYGTNYRKKDAYDLSTSRRIAWLYLDYWGKKAKTNPDYETLARIWNGGPNGWKKHSTLKYWKKVKKELEAND
jgi:hypothetical protein